MAFCKYCGKQIPEGGSCDCAESKAASEVKEAAENVADKAQETIGNAAENVKNEAAETVNDVKEKAADVVENAEQKAADAVNEVKNDAAQAVEKAENVVNEVKNDAAQNAEQKVEGAAKDAANGFKQLNGSDIAKKVDGIAGDISENLPGGMKNNKSLVYIAAGAVAALLFLLLVALMFGGGYKSAVKKYVKAAADKHGGKTMYSLTLPKSVIKTLKEDDDYDDKVDSYNEMIEDMIDDLDDKETLPKFDKITRKEKLKSSDLKHAEKYFEKMIDQYDADDDDVKVTKGYEVRVKTKHKDEDGDIERDKTTLCVVKVRGEGWKIIPVSADGLDYYK